MLGALRIQLLHMFEPDVPAEERAPEKRVLERGAVPTIDVAVAEPEVNKPESDHDIRWQRK